MTTLIKCVGNNCPRKDKNFACLIGNENEGRLLISECDNCMLRNAERGCAVKENARGKKPTEALVTIAERSNIMERKKLLRETARVLMKLHQDYYWIIPVKERLQENRRMRKHYEELSS
jgi:hypothetical protein